MITFSKILTVIMSLVISLTTVSITYERAEESDNLIDITSEYVIVRGENAVSSEVTASQKLQTYLKQISGIDINIVTDNTVPAKKEIIVGKTNREGKDYTVDREALGDEGVFIKTAGDKVVIAGGEKRGTLYSVYEFLTKYLGCRWYTWDLTVIPKKDKIQIPAEIDFTYVPILEFRETDWISPQKSLEYSVANHINSDMYRKIPEEMGGTQGYANNFAHTMSSLVPKSYFASNPEMFALGVLSGERTTDQPCLTNPDTLKVAIESCRKILKNNPGEIVCITQNDNQNYCVCENCKKVDEENGSHAGTMISFVNAVSEALTPEFPDAVFDTFAYQYTRQAPTKVKPNSNVIVRICSIECCFSHPLGDAQCEQNAAFKKDIDDWRKICKRIYIWDYTTNYANYNGPFPDFGVLQDNMKFFIENNVKGVYEEGNYSASQSNGEFAELRAYLIARLEWDPDMDYDRETAEFCDAYYGKAGKYVKKYIDYTTKKNGTKKSLFSGERHHMTIYNSVTAGNYGRDIFDFGLCGICYCDALWSKAKDQALSGEQMTRVRLSEISWRYWKACNHKSEFSKLRPKARRLEESRKLCDDMKLLGISVISEGGPIAENPATELIPQFWTVEEGTAGLNRNTRIAHPEWFI